MSHYLCLVVLPEGSTMPHVEGQTSRLLAPYDENLEMPPREEPCWCMGIRQQAPNAVPSSTTCSECDGSGVRLSTSNPLAKWDWWVIGGRWDGWIFAEREPASGDTCHTLESNVRPVRDIPLDEVDGMPFAVVTPDGQWHDADDVPDEWHRHVKDLAGHYPDHLAVAVDCHT
jgi:hypothetical protein